MPRLDAARIVELLRELAQRLELEGGNPYRARAYTRAADNLAVSPVPLAQLISEGRLQDIPGVGEAIAAVITKLYETGRHPQLEKMREKMPASVLEMLRIPGLRPERIRKLHSELGIDSVAQLEQAALSGRLKSLKGYGPAFQAKLLQGIEFSRRPRGRHIHRAAAAMGYAIAELKHAHSDWTNLTPAGEFRRGCELVGPLVIVAADPKLHREKKIATTGDQLTIHVTAKELFGVTLLLATGSDRHIAALTAVARSKGWSLDAHGLRAKTRILAGETEEEIYTTFGLPFIAPELRESGKEVQRALNGTLPELVTIEDLHGVLHAHTDWSDGVDTLKVMAKATRERGYAYLGLTDHSQSAHYAGGLKPDEVLRQQKDIDRLNSHSRNGFVVFRGIESDILADGSLDYPPEILDRFDLVIASVHSRFGMSKKDQTARIVKAVSNPYTTILGHITGRQLLRRPGYEVDMEAILRACAEHGVPIEINANPWRLDLDWRWCERALELGCLFSINPDAHSTAEIDNMQWGVLMARKGAVPKARIVNALGLEEFTAWLKQRRRPGQRRLKQRKSPLRQRTKGDALVR